MFLIALWYVWHFGSNVPSWDDWDMVPTMTHTQPVTLDWLWSQHNEHRVPLSRLIMLGVYQFWPDFRACMYLNVVLMAAMAAWLIRCAQRLRGHIAITDAFFPLALLGLSQGLNFIWAWQVEFFTSTFLALCILLLATSYEPSRELVIACLTTGCLILLCLSGAHGLALVPPMALWAGVLAVVGSSRRREVRRSHQLLLAALTIAAFLMVALYLRGYERVPYFPTTSGLSHTLKTALQFLTMSFGPAVKSVWPISGLLMTVFIVAGVVVLYRVIRNDPTERPRASGVFLFLCSMGLLALAIGLGRNGFEPRYITLAAPVLCALYIVFTLYLPQKAGSLASWALVAVACLCVWSNARSSLQYGSGLRTHLSSLERDIEAGVPPFELVHNYGSYLHPNQQLITDYLPLLRRAHIGSFQSLRDNPPFREISLPMSPLLMRKASFANGQGQTFAEQGQIVLRAAEPVNVAGIRFKFTVENKRHKPPFFYVAWRDNDREFQPDRSYYVSPTGDHANWSRGTWLRLNQPETETVVWVCDRVRDVLIQPDAQPCKFQISEVTLLVPPGIEH